MAFRVLNSTYTASGNSLDEAQQFVQAGSCVAAGIKNLRPATHRGVDYCQAELNEIVDIQIVSDSIAISPYFEGFVFHYLGEGGGYDAKALPGSLSWPVYI